ncbi:MAG: hypothetical protein K2J20_02075, partial [Bacilli bacterium]|nr:hypothetical protein [Bacilli bacterium]
MTQKKTKKKLVLNNKIVKGIMGILTAICLITLSIFSYFLFKINVVPVKYLIIGYTVITLLLLAIILIIFIKKNRALRI